jgi:hypothetical protein
MIVLPPKSSSVWMRFLKENNVMIYKYILSSISNAIKSGADSVQLFKFEDDSMVSWIPRENFIDTLNHAKLVFLKAEEYEYVQKTIVLTDRFHIETLLADINISEKKIEKLSEE